MTHSAHLCLVLDPSVKPTVIINIDIFDAPTIALTHLDGMVLAELCVMHGDSYQQAKAMLMEYLEHPSKEWIRDLMAVREADAVLYALGQAK